MIEELRLKNFEGYEDAEVKFTEGLNLITGRNSAGKTSLLDSILYGLFGTVPGIENKLLVSRRPSVKDADVYLRFRSPKNNSRIEISRRLEIRQGKVYSANARFLIDGKEVQVESLEDLRKKVSSLLGIGYRSFNWIVYSKQGKILEILEPKKEEMDTVLGISLLQEFSEQLDQVRKKLSRINGVDVETEYRNLVMYIIPSDEERLREVEEDIQAISKEIEEIRRELTSIESPTTPILFQKIRELEKLRSMLLEVRNTKRELLSRYAIEKIDSVINEEARIRDELRKMLDEIHELEKRINEKITENASISSKIKNLKQHLEQHQKLVKEGSGICPTCRQTINMLMMFEIISQEENEIANLEKILHQSEEELSTLKKTLENKKKDERENRERRERLYALIETFKELEGRESNITRLVNVLEAEVDSMLRSLNIDVNVRDPQLLEKLSYFIQSQEVVQAKKKKIKELDTKLSSKIKIREDLLKKLEIEKTRLNELERRAKAAGIASSLRDKIQEILEKKREAILKILASRTLDILNSITDQGFYYSIIIDPQTYLVNVHPLGLAEPIPATRIGGGHQTLIALALRLSILHFINFRHLMILDEPTYGVDQENLQLLLNHLSSLGQYMRQTIIVTHHGYGLEEADNIITIYKDSKGVSRIKQEL